MHLLPIDISFAEALVLISTSGLASLMTASLGIGGGMLMLAVMAQIVPGAALIPAHGIVQLGSNGNRAYITRQHIDWDLLKMFLVGSALGAGVASLFVIQLPMGVIEISVALFILWTTWVPRRKDPTSGSGRFSLVGFFTTLLSMFVGATGPLVAATVHRIKTNRMEGIATFSACMTSQNLLKLFVFSLAGFQFVEWLPLLLLMIGAGALGTWTGIHLLHKIPAKRFQLILRITLSILAFRLLWQAMVDAFSLLST